LPSTSKRARACLAGNITIDGDSSGTHQYSALLIAHEEYDLIVDRTRKHLLEGPLRVTGDGGRSASEQKAQALTGSVMNEKHEPVGSATITLIPIPRRTASKVMPK